MTARAGALSDVQAGAARQPHYGSLSGKEAHLQGSAEARGDESTHPRARARRHHVQAASRPSGRTRLGYARDAVMAEERGDGRATPRRRMLGVYVLAALLAAVVQGPSESSCRDSTLPGLTKVIRPVSFQAQACKGDPGLSLGAAVGGADSVYSPPLAYAHTIHLENASYW